MATDPAGLQRQIALLAQRAGALPSLPPRDPWHAILFENVAYLCDDDARASAFAQLSADTDLDAEVIERAPDEVLLAACEHGKMARQRIEKLRECARLFIEVGDPRKIVEHPLAKARAALKKFPGIGDPGADRLLLFAGKAPLTALESNGLRVMLRLGHGQEHKNYATSYRSAVRAIDAALPESAAARVQLYHLARRHGQEVCRATPACAGCVLAKACPGRRSS